MSGVVWYNWTPPQPTPPPYPFLRCWTTPAQPNLPKLLFGKICERKMAAQTNRWLITFTFVHTLERVKGEAACLIITHNLCKHLSQWHCSVLIYSCVKCSPLFFLFICIVRQRTCQWLFLSIYCYSDVLIEFFSLSNSVCLCAMHESKPLKLFFFPS